ncbi:MAG: TfoX/Sxy family protein [Hyphomicrobiaceae bacterium]
MSEATRAMANSELNILLEEMLAPLGPVALRRMFGGYGIFLDGLMFGLVTGERVYFKTDETGRAAFQAEGLGPFTYAKKGAPAVLTSYWQVPDRLFDEPDELVDWARTAHRCAIDAQRAKRGKDRKVPSRATRSRP